MPTISVIVPVYNVEKYLRCCVDSILAQTFTDIEVLLVDDGSTDSSGAICDEYAKQDSRVRVFHKVNGGVSSARNLGLDEAMGKWIMFVDSDDKVAPEICVRLLGLTSENCMPMCTYYTWNGEHLCRSMPEVNAGQRHSLEEVLTLGNRISMVWGKLYSCEIIKQTNQRFEVSATLAEDAIFNYDYFKNIEAFYLIDEPLYYYRYLANSLSHGKYVPNLEETIKKLHSRKMILLKNLEISGVQEFDANYFYSMCTILANNMHKDAPGTWFEKMRRNNAVLRSEEFAKVWPYRHNKQGDFTKRYIFMLEIAYRTGNYFWLWLLGIPGKIKKVISRKI